MTVTKKDSNIRTQSDPWVTNGICDVCDMKGNVVVHVSRGMPIAHHCEKCDTSTFNYAMKLQELQTKVYE
jgi:hypothetical protein